MSIDCSIKEKNVIYTLTYLSNKIQEQNCKRYSCSHSEQIFMGKLSRWLLLTYSDTL